jgi:5'-phosphate synthase pdxT subunit
MSTIVGVLALQGGYASHIAVLESIGAETLEVRTVADLARCGSLIIPGGESTVMTRLLMKGGTGPGAGKPWEPGPLFLALKDFTATYPVMGTCAGLIMLARPCGDERVVSLDALPVSVERNAYGRQTESFVMKVDIDLGGAKTASRSDVSPSYTATFIRAPKIIGVEKGVDVLASAKDARGEPYPVMVRSGNILGLAFHPELTPGDARIHEYFLTLA